MSSRWFQGSLTLTPSSALRSRESLLHVKRVELERDPMQGRSTLTQAYETAKRAALKRLERGSRLGGGSLPPGGELYDRASLR